MLSKNTLFFKNSFLLSNCIFCVFYSEEQKNVLENGS